MRKKMVKFFFIALVASLVVFGIYNREPISDYIQFTILNISARLGNTVSQVNLGNMYYEASLRGNGVAAKKAFIWYCKAAETHNPEAQYYVGLCYYKGRGVKKDYSEAIKRLQLSLDNGYARAEKLLGIVYYDNAMVYVNAKGYVQDDNEAIRLFKLAAENKHADAAYALGCIYRSGKRVNQDYSKSMKWLKIGAENGSLEAQYDLSLAYKNGKMCNRDIKQAYFWALIASTSESTTARELSSDLARMLTQEQRHSLQTQAKNWYEKQKVMASRAM